MSGRGPARQLIVCQPIIVFLGAVLHRICGHSLHKGLPGKKKRWSTDHQPGTKSGRRVANNKIIHHLPSARRVPRFGFGLKMMSLACAFAETSRIFVLRWSGVRNGRSSSGRTSPPRPRPASVPPHPAPPCPTSLHRASSCLAAPVECPGFGFNSVTYRSPCSLISDRTCLV